MDGDFAVALGTIVGASAASFGVVLVIGLRLWRGIKAVLAGNDTLSAALTGAVGHPEQSAPTGGGARQKQQTGAFQAMLRVELEEHLQPIERRLDEMGERLDTHADLVADLARGHNAVVQRTREHSAKLNITEAEQTLTSGRQAG